MGTALLLSMWLTASPSATRQAQALAHRSIAEYNVGDFQKALDDAKAAYEADPLPALLFNVGQCHRALGHWELAALAYRGYLRGLPAAPNREKVKKLIAELDAKFVADAGHAAVAPPRPPPAAPVASEQPAAPPAPEAATSAPAPEPHHSRALAYAAGSVGIAAAVVAAIGFGEAASFDSTNFSGQTYAAEVQPLQNARTWEVSAIVCTVVAAAGLATAGFTW